MPRRKLKVPYTTAELATVDFFPQDIFSFTHISRHAISKCVSLICGYSQLYFNQGAECWTHAFLLKKPQKCSFTVFPSCLMHHFLSYFLPARVTLLLARPVALVTSESSQTSLCSGSLLELCYFILRRTSETCTLFFSCCHPDLHFNCLLFLGLWLLLFFGLS